ncbi:MAG TPA: 50S ribosomal protein L3 [Candidatus Pacearchaeota archaeon]|nr:50S ribosomal protein L3 [Candidatus Pacearchaeota archaeon]
MKFILGKKIGMSQVFQGDKVIPVSLVEIPALSITQIKTEDQDGYQAVQIGVGAEKGRPKIKREVRLEGELSWKIGDQIKADIFEPGDRVKVTGYSKGKGFQGVVKRWGFSGRNASHGGKGQVRTLGSVGSRFPQRVIKGRKMPGQMGYQKTTVRNLEIVEVDVENSLLAIKGAIPGPKHSLLIIQEL